MIPDYLLNPHMPAFLITVLLIGLLILLSYRMISDLINRKEKTIARNQSWLLVVIILILLVNRIFSGRHISEISNTFDLFNLFLLGSTSLIITVFAYGECKKNKRCELNSCLFLSTASAVLFFAAGIFAALPIIFPPTLITIINSFLNYIKVGFIFLGMLDLFSAALELFENVGKKYVDYVTWGIKHD